MLDDQRPRRQGPRRGIRSGFYTQHDVRRLDDRGNLAAFHDAELADSLDGRLLVVSSLGEKKQQR